MKSIMGLLMASLLCLASCSCWGQKVDNSTVKSLDLNRYLGDWYEIARYNHSFERGLTHAKANYSLNDDGTISVSNSGFKNGKYKLSIGKAKVTDTAGLANSGINVPLVAEWNVPPVAFSNVPPQKWLR